jgi:hypothetical protein
MRTPQELIDDINSNFISNVSSDAKFTIYTIRNLIESNSRVENSVDELHRSINKSNIQNDKLQKRIYMLTVVAVFLTLIQALAVVLELYNKF